MTTTRQMSQTELDELIADEFGVNADYVSVLLGQFEQNPASVDEEWREYFDELLGKDATAPGDGARQSGARQYVQKQWLLPTSLRPPPKPAASEREQQTTAPRSRSSSARSTDSTGSAVAAAPLKPQASRGGCDCGA